METKEKNIVALFADIRGFSHMFEILPPSQIYRFTNRYFETAYKIIKQYRGTLDNIVGDGLLAIWGRDEEKLNPKAPFLAVRAALEMRMALLRQNVQYKWEYHFPLEIGIGIDMGPALHCLVGPKQKAIDTFYGRPVILASRLGDLAKNNFIFVSENIANTIKKWAGMEKAKETHVQGFRENIKYYRVFGLMDFTLKNGERRKTSNIRYVAPEIIAMIFEENGIRKPVILKNISSTGAGVEIVRKDDVNISKNKNVLLDLKRLLRGIVNNIEGQIVQFKNITQETDEIRSLWQIGIQFTNIDEGKKRLIETLNMI